MEAVRETIAAISAVANTDFKALESLHQSCDEDDLARAALIVAADIAKWAAQQLRIKPSDVMQAIALRYENLPREPPP